MTVTGNISKIPLGVTCSCSCAARSIPQPPSTFFTTASLGPKDTLAILNQLCTPSSLLFDPRYTSRLPPSPLPPFRTFPPSPTAQRLPFSVPSTISLQNLNTEEEPAEMDKRNPSSFQQLEKLGEGTYATVSNGKAIFYNARIFFLSSREREPLEGTAYLLFCVPYTRVEKSC